MGPPIAKIVDTITGLLRSQSLLVIRRRNPPNWPNAFGPECLIRNYGMSDDASITWLVVANGRLDLVRGAFAFLATRPANQRPHLLIVVADPTVRDDYRAVASAWFRLFEVSFSLVLPLYPPTPESVLRFAETKRADGTLLLSPAQVFSDDDTWIVDLARTAREAPTGVALALAAPDSAPPWENIPTLCWTRPLPSPWPQPVRMNLRRAPSVVHLLPRPNLQTVTGRIQAWIYRRRERLLSLAGWTLAAAGWPRHGLTCRVSRCALLADRGYLITGWISDPSNRIQHIYLIHNRSAKRIDLTKHWVRRGDPDANRAFRFVSLPEPPRGFDVFIADYELSRRDDACHVSLVLETRNTSFVVWRGAVAASPDDASIKTQVGALRSERKPLL